ncbi:hypothetical protein BDF14DRAFT_1758083 [Spinellus fusiger]|nr:hypothetical protein BDF14DRAFT_1758083 [Spinellus fusiger]
MTLLPNSEKLFKTLSYRVTYDSKHELLATWLCIEAHCKYCKAMGHDVANYPSKPKELRSCFMCQAIGYF